MYDFIRDANFKVHADMALILAPAYSAIILQPVFEKKVSLQPPNFLMHVK